MVVVGGFPQIETLCGMSQETSASPLETRQVHFIGLLLPTFLPGARIPCRLLLGLDVGLRESYDVLINCVPARKHFGLCPF